MAIIVPFEGPSNAHIYLVGEAPGATEELEGKPFVGGAGRLLNRLLMETGLTRSECRIGNVMRVRPPANDFSHFYMDKQRREARPELREGIAFLKADIKATNPNVVVALGNEPLRALTGLTGITNWRGSILFSKDCGCKVIPTVHPAALLRAWSNVPLVMFDFRRVKEESLSPDYQYQHRTFTIRPTFEEVMMKLNLMQSSKRVSFDVETDTSGHITALALANSANYAVCIPFTNSNGAPYWTDSDEIAIWRRVKMLMEDERVEKIAHNEQFDRIMFLTNPYHIEVKGMWMDTMAAFHTVYPEIAASEKEDTTGTMKNKIGGGKKLALLCSIYTKQPYYKHWGKSGNDEEFWRYNCMDAAVTWEAAGKLESEMKEFGVNEFYKRVVGPLLPVCMKIQMRGVRVDDAVRREALEMYEKETVELESKLNGALGRVVNVASPKQLAELLYDDLGFPVQYKRGTTSVTTDEKALDDLSRKYESPIFDIILQIRRNRKLIGTYLEGNVGEDGRMRCSYVVGGTETGRLSSRGSVFGTGTNLQNFPRGVCRKMLTADEGMVMIAADQSQAEARIVAYLAEEKRMIEVFERREDIHQLSANALPEGFVPTGNEYIGIDNPRRLFAKKHNHAFNYGESAFGFAHHARVEKRVAEQIRDRYFDMFPAIKTWQLLIQSQLSRCRTMTTPLGRKRTFFGMWNEQLFREAYAYIPQSTVGDVNNIAMIKLGEIGEEILLTTHDEVVIQCPKKGVEKAIANIRKAFDVPLMIKGREVRIPIEMKVGSNWEEMEKIK